MDENGKVRGWASLEKVTVCLPFLVYFSFGERENSNQGFISRKSANRFESDQILLLLSKNRVLRQVYFS